MWAYADAKVNEFANANIEYKEPTRDRDLKAQKNNANFKNETHTQKGGKYSVGLFPVKFDIHDVQHVYYETKSIKYRFSKSDILTPKRIVYSIILWIATKTSPN